MSRKWLETLYIMRSDLDYIDSLLHNRIWRDLVHPDEMTTVIDLVSRWRHENSVALERAHDIREKS